jgi:hypothetical protein
LKIPCTRGNENSRIRTRKEVSRRGVAASSRGSISEQAVPIFVHMRRQALANSETVATLGGRVWTLHRYTLWPPRFRAWLCLLPGRPPHGLCVARRCATTLGRRIRALCRHPLRSPRLRPRLRLVSRRPPHRLVLFRRHTTHVGRRHRLRACTDNLPSHDAPRRADLVLGGLRKQSNRRVRRGGVALPGVGGARGRYRLARVAPRRLVRPFASPYRAVTVRESVLT